MKEQKWSYEPCAVSVENSSSGLARFGLKRADAGHKPPEPAARRTEITLGKPQEPRRAESRKGLCRGFTEMFISATCVHHPRFREQRPGTL
uniref:Uncharacterized protein n=1 Tax=Ficedula albicollis TaxID=59894 RepID=A0A803W3Z4_FICAL